MTSKSTPTIGYVDYPAMASVSGIILRYNTLLSNIMDDMINQDQQTNKPNILERIDNLITLTTEQIATGKGS